MSTSRAKGLKRQRYFDMRHETPLKKRYSMNVHCDNCTSAGQGESSGDKLGIFDNPVPEDFLRCNKLKLRTSLPGILKPRFPRNF